MTEWTTRMRPEIRIAQERMDDASTRVADKLSVDVVIDAVIARLRTDPRMPKLTRNEWDEALRDPMLDAEDVLERRLSGLVNIDEVIDAIVDAFVDEMGA
jgi:hypothetical protein